MILETWHIAMLILFIIACVVLNYISGFKKGMELTLSGLMESDIIEIKLQDNRLIISSKNGKYIKTVDAADLIR